MKPADVPAVNRLLKQAYLRSRAPVVDLIQAQTRDPFKVLLATILSARTKDHTTAQAAARLFEVVGNPHDLRNLPRDEIERRIFPVGFYHVKARHLKELPDALDAEFGGTLPDNVEDLCRLPGVGRKTANLVVAVGFAKPAICVDVHVHRISNRLGLVRTPAPLATEMALRRTLPRRYWRSWNSYLVAYGQTVCTPRKPKCADCRIGRFCDRVGID